MTAASTRKTARASKGKTMSKTNPRVWSEEEHDKFLVGIKMFPKGPWRMIAAQVGSRTPRQVQTHAQKYYEKVARRLRGLRKDRKKLMRPEHRLDEDMANLCRVAEHDVTGTRIGGPIIGCGLNAVSSPMSVETVTAEDDEEGEFGAFEQDGFYTRPQSFVSLLTDDCGEGDVVLSDLDAGTDSDDADSLIDFDDYCLDYLMEVLESSTHDESCCSEYM